MIFSSVRKGFKQPQDGEEPSRPRRPSRIRSFSFCCLQGPYHKTDEKQNDENENFSDVQLSTMSPVANLHRKAYRRKSRIGGTVTLHPPRSDVLVNMSRLSRQAASTPFVEQDVPTQSPTTKKRKDVRSLSAAQKSEKKQHAPSSHAPRDPITLEDLGQHRYVFVRPGGSTQAYNVISLVDYVLSTGMFLEPVSRISFSDDELVRLDESVRRAGLVRGSLVEARKDTTTYVSQKQAQNLSLGIDRMVGDIVVKMMAVVESPDSEDGQMELVVNLFPEFETFFQQLTQIDPIFARQCATNYSIWIRGPPNKPTRDISGLLDVVTGFIDAQGIC